MILSIDCEISKTQGQILSPQCTRDPQNVQKQRQAYSMNYTPSGKLLASAMMLIVISTMGDLTSARKLRIHRDKTVLFDKYPQLTANTTCPCVRGINKYLISYLEFPYTKMNEYAFHQIMELGYYEACQEIGGDFVVMNSNITHLIGMARMGLCMPRECTQPIYDKVVEGMISPVNGYLEYLADYYNHPVLHGAFVREWTRVGMTLTKSADYTDDWQNRTAAGVIPTALFIFAILAFVMVVNIIKYYRYKQAKFNAKRRVILGNEEFNNDSMLQNQLINNLSQSQDNLENQNNSRGTLTNGRNLGGAGQAMALNLSGTMSYDQSMSMGGAQVKRINDSTRLTYDPQQRVSQNDLSPIQPERRPSLAQQIKLDSEKTDASAISKLMSFSSLNAIREMLQGDTKSWDQGKNELDVFNALKFFHIFLILITCTATYLILAAPTNPWIMAVFFDNVMFTMVIAGIIAMDCFFTYSAFLAFYRISQIYDAKKAMGASGFGLIDVLKIYAKRLLRLLPMFYLTFLVGMFLIPRVSSGGIWFSLEQALFFECDKYWWASFLLVSNFVPWDQNAKGGCMPWGWAIAADFQLYLFIPLYVVIYKKSRTAGLILAWSILAAGTAIICLIVTDFNLTAGAYTLENWFMYAMYLNKPYCKLQVHALGILFAILYFDLLEYRKIKQRNEEIAKSQYPKIHFLSTNFWFGKFMLYAGLTMIITNLFISYGCTKNPYAWSNFGNMAFFSLTRSSYSLGWMLVAFYIFFGHTKVGMVLLASSPINGCGRLVYPAYLISPIVMMVVYCNTDHGIMMTLIGNVTLGMGHLMISFIIGAMMYIMIMFPIKRAIQITLHPFVSHEDMIKVYHKKMGDGSFLQ